VHLPRIDPQAAALGDALTATLEHAAHGGDIEPVVRIADQIIAAGLFTSTRGELVSMMLFRLELDSALTPPSPYYALSRRLVDEGLCTAGEMKAAVCGTLLMRGQEQGWLEPHLYDLLVEGTRDRPDWRLAMSLVARRDAGSTPTRRAAEN